MTGGVLPQNSTSGVEECLLKTTHGLSRYETRLVKRIKTFYLSKGETRKLCLLLIEVEYLCII